MLIRSAQYIISSPGIAQCPKAEFPEYAFIGRSNVGKSSLINMLTGLRHLAKTSSTPGKTQLINHFLVESVSDKKGTHSPPSRWYLVDLPGYGYAKVSIASRRKWEKMIEEYLRKRETLVNVFILLDVRHKPQQADIAFVNQLGEWRIPFCLVFTKSDKITQLEASRHVKEFLAALKKTWEVLPKHFVTSAVKQHGRKGILDFIESCNSRLLG
jgi:GTP-binding protein